LLFWKLHNRAKLQGCVAGEGDKLVSEKNNQTYSLTNKLNESLKPGERVELLGKKAKNDSGEPTVEVHKMNMDLGQCTATTAEQRQ
jgi:surface antigen